MHAVEAAGKDQYLFDWIETSANGKIPKHFTLGAYIWFGICTTTSLIDIYHFVSILFIPIALFCYWVLLFRPTKEAPFALLLLATGASDILIFLGPILFLIRLGLQRNIYIPDLLHGHLFLLFLSCVIASAFISWTTVEFRPFQTLFWSITFLAPLAISCTGFRISTNHEAVARYIIALITLELLPVLAQIPLFLSTGNVDVIQGTWMNANIVGFWGACLLMATLIWFLNLKGLGIKKHLMLIIVALLLMIMASGKTYSAMVITAGFSIFFLSSVTVKKFVLGKLKIVAFTVLTVGVGIFITAQAYQAKPAVEKWANYQVDNSRKIIFLRRVFLEMDSFGYSNLFGVGPGMLGSRAANSVSGNILAKEQTDLPGFLMNAPKPVATIMDGLFTRDLMESLKWMSATLVMPFSGLAAVKGELGWSGFLLLIGIILARYWPKKHQNVDSVRISIAQLIGACAGISIIGLALFDTVLEMPKITVFLSGIMLGLQGVNRTDITRILYTATNPTGIHGAEN